MYSYDVKYYIFKEVGNEEPIFRVILGKKEKNGALEGKISRVKRDGF